MPEPWRPTDHLDCPIGLAALPAAALLRCADTLDRSQDAQRAAAGWIRPSCRDPA